MGKMGNKKKSVLAFVVLIVILVAAGIFLYYKYMNKQQNQDVNKAPATEVDKLLKKDMEASYPETPVEVMKLWGRYNQCIYNTDMNEEQLKTMLHQIRTMYSKELLEKNPEDAHLERLRKELDEFQSSKKTIVSYSAETGVSVKYKEIKDRECAKARISYFINQRKGYVKQYQDFLLVREDGRWKVYGFKKVSEEKAEKP